jgi:YfiH family protein
MSFSHHFFDRTGGVSSGLFAQLNLSFGVGDTFANVLINRDLVKQHFGAAHLVSADQVHGSRVCAVDDELTADLEVASCDALLTCIPGRPLLIQQADCQAVLLHDPVRSAVAAIHCGWRGSVADIIGKTINEMKDRYRTIPADLQACIGPSLGPCCAEFVNYRDELPESFLRYRNAVNHFDFWRISADQLIRAGVRAEAISLPSVCTSCSDDYFSYRRAVREADGITGRHGSAICLNA